jgi:SPP1 gp7 family putative phage head morphogenesis protein
VAELPDLRALFNLRPERAADYLAAKGLRLTGPYWELDGPAHSRVFTVANLAKLDVLADIRDAVQGAIDSGQTERWFRGELVDVLKRKGWWGPSVQVDPDTGEARMVQQGSLRRLQTIYRTNLQASYMAGRHRQALEQAERAPFAQYLAVRDSRTRPGHAALHGRVFRLDSPEWSIVAPPNGYNCRCRARYLSQAELDARGLKPETDTRLLEQRPERVPVDRATGESPARVIKRGVSVPSRDGHGRDTLMADLGWDHLPGGTGGERKLVERMMARAEDFGGVKELILGQMAERAPEYVRASVAAGAAKQNSYILEPSLHYLSGRAEAAGIERMDLRRAALVLDHDRVRHIAAQHGNQAREAARGQRAVQPEDYARLPDVLRRASAVRRPERRQTSGGAPLLELDAELDGERWTLILEARRKQAEVAVYSMWVRPARAVE